MAEHSLSATRKLRGHTDQVFAVAFSPTASQLASGGRDKAIRLWDPATGQTVRKLVGHQGEVRSLSYSPDGARLASAGLDGAVFVWHLRADDQRSKPHTVAQLDKGALAVAFSPDGALLAASSLGSNDVQVWETRGWSARKRLIGHGSFVRSVKFSPDSTALLTGSNDKTVRLWSLATSKTEWIGHGHSDGVINVAMNADGTLVASAGADHQVRLWKATDGQLLRVLDDHAGRVYAVAFSPDGRKLASSGLDRTVRLWNLAAAQRVPVDSGHREPAVGVAFAPSGKQVASASSDDTIIVRDIATGQPLQLLTGHRDDTLIVGFANGEVGLWDEQDGVRLNHTRVHGAVKYMMLEGSALNIVSELGVIHRWDLTVFDLPYCELMRRVWSVVPTEWESGRAVAKAVPATHRCVEQRH